MIRRLLQAPDPDLLTVAISGWLTGRITTAQAPAIKRAIAVDGKTLRASRTADTTARHVLAACDQDTGVMLAGTDVGGKTNEITRFQPLLDQIGYLRDTHHQPACASSPTCTTRTYWPQTATIGWRSIPNRSPVIQRSSCSQRYKTVGTKCSVPTIHTGRYADGSTRWSRSWDWTGSGRCAGRWAALFRTHCGSSRTVVAPWKHHKPSSPNR